MNLERVVVLQREAVHDSGTKIPSKQHTHSGCDDYYRHSVTTRKEIAKDPVDHLIATTCSRETSVDRVLVLRTRSRDQDDIWL